MKDMFQSENMKSQAILDLGNAEMQAILQFKNRAIF